jgi:hypothetical protein
MFPKIALFTLVLAAVIGLPIPLKNALRLIPLFSGLWKAMALVPNQIK